MKPSEILRKAAELVDATDHEDGCLHYGCWAIQQVTKPNLPLLQEDTKAHEYYEMFRPIDCIRGAWFSLAHLPNYNWLEETYRANFELKRNMRVLALLMAADIAESEGI